MTTFDMIWEFIMDHELVLQTQLKLSLQRIRQQIADLELMDIRSKRSQELFTALFISSPIGIFIVQGGKFVNVNPQFEKLIGISKMDLIGRESLSLVIPEDRESVAVNARKMLKGGDTEPYEYRVIQEDGSVKWIMETVTSIQYMGSTATLGNFMDITSRKQTEAALVESQEHYRDLFENANDIIYIHDLKGRFVGLNKRALEISGYQLEEVIDHNFLEVIAPQYHVLVTHTMVRDIFLGLTPTYELEMITKNGNLVPLEVRPRLLKKNGIPYGVQGIARDITERKQMETELRATNQRLLDIIEFLPDATFVIDNQGQVIAWNRAIETMTGLNKNAIIGRGQYLYAVPFYGSTRPMLADLIGNPSLDANNYYEEVRREGNSLYTEIFAPGMYDAKGAYIWVKASPLMDADGKLVGAIESIRDISERKHFEEQLRYLSLHDGLTNLYNRTYFEEEINRLETGRFQSTGLLICDVDGLKLVNDTLGHDAGDNLLIGVARVLQSCFRGEDVVARVGGDEFAILMPHSDETVTEIACMRIREAVNMYNFGNPEIPLSLSLGFAVRSTPATTMTEVYQAADNNMYREKLHRRQSARSAIVNTLMKALQARDFITEGHADRLQDMVAMLGEAIGLPGHRISDLRLFAEFHDIGKVGIPDRILFKTGPLSKDETFEMQRHSEIGHRIALSAPDLAPIADWILKHHEWWNGNGYPMGLREAEIPLECRILSIADAYDAMTNDRPYRPAMPKRLALEELEKYAGTQFDPSLVETFAHIVRRGEQTDNSILHRKN
ncbi:MAG: PAS domain S-box protein [Syntrophomonadaceae bacterium]|nr:PAS domain S-box protein [Syntrophomonadaceae bacterium]